MEEETIAEANSFFEDQYEEDPPLPLYQESRRLFASPPSCKRNRDFWGRSRKDSFGVDLYVCRYHYGLHRSVDYKAESMDTEVVNPFDKETCENFPKLDSAFDIPLSEVDSDEDCSDASLELKYELSNEPEFGTPDSLCRQFSTTDSSYTSPVNGYFKSVPMTDLKTPYRESAEFRQNREPNVTLFK